MGIDFWRNKRVLVTGHTGFKGSWLSLWLQHLGAKVYGVALQPATDPSLFRLARLEDGMQSRLCDIRDGQRLGALIRDCKPEIVFHLAAQPIVLKSYLEPITTFETNIMGSAHLLNGLRGLDSVRVAIMVTTDKVYRDLALPYPCREEDALGGHDPYSASKAASEIVIASYRDAFLKDQGVAIATARAGNVIGGGDWSEHRLIPDAVRAWQSNEVLAIRRPQAIRPWQHVLEPLNGYLTLAQRLWGCPELAGAYNFGPYTHEAATVCEVVELSRQAYGKGEVSYGDGSTGPLEAGWLALETAKARIALSLQPQWDLTESVRRTMSWYRAQQSGANAKELCLTEIAEYVKE